MLTCTYLNASVPTEDKAQEKDSPAVGLFGLRTHFENLGGHPEASHRRTGVGGGTELRFQPDVNRWGTPSTNKWVWVVS